MHHHQQASKKQGRRQATSTSPPRPCYGMIQPSYLHLVSVLLPLITLLTCSSLTSGDDAPNEVYFELQPSRRPTTSSPGGDSKPAPPLRGGDGSESGSSGPSGSSEKPNLVFVVADQLRFDALRFVQDGLSQYDGKLKIRTPHIDRLAARGVVFENAYCQAAVCGASRSSFMTGNTIRRTGVSNNIFMSDQVIEQYPVHKERVDRLRSFEQILVDEMGYNGIHVGKWHLPSKFLYSSTTDKPLVRNHYTLENDSFTFTLYPGFGRLYRPNLEYMLRRDGLVKSTARPVSYMTKVSYAPIALDPMHGVGQSMGRDTLAANYSTTSVAFRTAIAALDRLVDEGGPFLLSVQNGPPHPPYISSGEYMNSYYYDRDHLFVSPSISDPMKTSAYYDANQDATWRNATSMAELVAVYYGMVEELDTWMGRLMDQLELRGVWNNTLLIFTSDHGEMLGAHGRISKETFYEESARVPIIMSLPNGAKSGSRVSNPVSLLDLHATILDYLDVPKSLDTSDGRSLRRYVEHSSYNAEFDDTIVVTEYEYGGAAAKARGYGFSPAFMIRKGDFKLILPRIASSPKVDMLYNLKNDRFETRNLLVAAKKDLHVIGKAEGLKVLLVEWLRRHDTEYQYFSSPKYSYNRTLGDIQEVTKRRTWGDVPIWLSDSSIQFGTPSKTTPQGDYRRNEYLYLGRTIPGVLIVHSVTVRGRGAAGFTAGPITGSVSRYGSLRIKVAYYSATDAGTNLTSGMRAFLDIRTSETNHTIPLVWSAS